MALSAMEENIRELYGRSGAYPYYQASNAAKLATRRYKEGKEEDTRRWQTEFDRQTELDKLNEELSRANLALNQATSGRADVSAEMDRIGSLYGFATPEARMGTREYMIGKGYIPESLRNETMIDPERTQNYRDVYPAAQAGLYPYAGAATTAGLTAPTTRIVNAPAGTQVNPMQNAYLQLALLKGLQGIGQSGYAKTPSKNVNFATGKTQTVQPYSGPYESVPGVWTAMGGYKTLKQYGY